jgi:hypothetical protein
MVFGCFAVLTGHVVYRRALNGRSKPIEESHAFRLASVEPIQHVGTSAVVQRICGKNSVVVPADDAFVVPPAGKGCRAETDDPAYTEFLTAPTPGR